jgi:hypothetical protein
MSPPRYPPRCVSGICECGLKRYSLPQLDEKYKKLQQRFGIMIGKHRSYRSVLFELNQRSDEVQEELHLFACGAIQLHDYEQILLLEIQHRYNEQRTNQENLLALAEERMAFLSYRMDWVMFHIHLAWEEEQQRYAEEVWRLDQSLLGFGGF